MLSTLKRESQIRLFKDKSIHRLKVNAYRAAKVDQVGDDLLVLKVFANVQDQRAAKINRGNVAFAEIRPTAEIEVGKLGKLASGNPYFGLDKQKRTFVYQKLLLFCLKRVKRST